MVPSPFKYIISSYLNPALSGQKCSGAKNSFIVFDFVLAQHGFIYQVHINLTLSHPVSVVNMSFMQGEAINFVDTYCIWKCLLQLC